MDGNIWIITDTHFNHTNMIKYENRPENFNEIIIEKWNKLVGADDTIIHLGDIMLGRVSEMKMLMASLHGKKFLIKGNHDKQNSQWYKENGFEDVLKPGYTIGKLIFSHYPLTPFYGKNGSMNVHGHFHRKSLHTPSGSSLDKHYDPLYYLQNQHHYYNLSAWFEDTLSPIKLDKLEKQVLQTGHY